MTRARRAALALLASTLLALTGPSPVRAQGEVYLEVRRNDIPRMPVLVEDFVLDPELGVPGATALRCGNERAEDLLARDLLFTDALVVLRAAAGDSADGLRLDVQGRPVGAAVRARVAGRVTGRRGAPSVEVTLLDEGSHQRILERRLDAAWVGMEVSCDAWPLHRLADDITLYLTGIPGCAATRIAFVRADGPVKELHLVDADGRNQEVVTALRSIVLSPAWDAEGSRLAFTTFHRGGPQLVALRLADGRMSTLCGRGTPGAAAYSPDGRWIAYSSTETGDAEIFVARADGSEPRRLTFHPAIDTSPGWAPSGQRLVFTSDRTGTPQLFLADADGVHLDQITFDGDWNDSPDWSRRGNRIVHVCLIDKRFELALIRPDGSGWQRLTTGGGCENPTWAPDGRHVVFARSQGGSRSLWVLDADTGSLRPLTAATSQTYNPAWSPSMRERIRASGRAE